ncbi:hypothetical protein Pelo_3277 [Pelomyxa schiedti]|nr:hypothetical protein Pelo_3277 [Pelomyxa schiedti]
MAYPPRTLQAQPRYVVYEENDDDNYDCDQEDAETTAERRSVMQQMCDVRQQTEQLLSHLQAPQESQPQATTPPMQMHSPATHKHVQDLERRGRRKHKPRKHPNATTPPNGSTSSAIAAASMLQQQPPQQQHSQHDFYEDPRLQQDQSSQETGDAQYSQTQQDSRMFYSPLFQEYKSLRFYGGLLATTQQYAKHLDTTDKTGLRLLVWKELLHIAGISESGQTQIPTLDPLSASTSTVHQEHNTSSSGTTAPSSTAPHSSTQSDQAPNTTEPNVVKTENGTTSSPQNASYEESSNILATSHDQKPVPNQNAQPPLTAQELANVPDGPVFDFIITKLLGYEQVNLAVLDLMYAAFLHAQRRYPDIFRHMFTPVPEDNSSTKPCDAIWSFGVQATLLQLHLVLIQL